MILLRKGSNMIDKIMMKLAWLLPRKLAYWSAIRVGAHATTEQYSTTIVPELTFADALQRWEK